MDNNELHKESGLEEEVNQPQAPVAEMDEFQAGLKELDEMNEDSDGNETFSDEEFSTDHLDDIEMDISSFSKEEIITHFRKIITHRDINRIKIVAETLKSQFYRKLKDENEERRKKFVDDGGKLEEYIAEESPVELIFKELYKSYKDRRTELIRSIENENKANLEKKKAIIEKVKELVNKPESLNDTFEEFRRLRQEWDDAGLVPQAEQNNIYVSYQHAIQLFYDWVKLNKEALEEDLKRNLENKIDLCDKAESLILEPDVKKALSELKTLHERWREVGPVKREKNEEIWQRFREASSKIYKSHQEYFLKKKDEQEGNLNAKNLLCEKAEEISAIVPEKKKDWEKATKDMLDLQQVWKSIGMVPRSANGPVYKRFREACQVFFENKKTYYEGLLSDEMANMQKKLDLCIQAESLKESTDWKRTTEQLINLQKKWKTIGPVPRKNSDEIWNRFRAACNAFFENKQKHFSSLGEMVSENIVKKEEIIRKVKDFQLTGDHKADLKQLKFFQNDWTETGQVPANDRERLVKDFRQAINSHFENMRLDEGQKDAMQFRIRLDELMLSGSPRDAISKERTFIIQKLRALETDIKLWENNIGFFSKSANADKMLIDFRKKIENGKLMVDSLKNKIKMIDEIKL
ncbi:MAG: DUF349 domain-containing protein [Bacteroidetes bacterium HGW-Bacteroidetes-21]|jgi:hypothetical protein|nr:MAG: DUF349 domain-containing protein [Bacteroidetes bacterium HGW-Bacteroidetes-21]